ncbi:MAG: hypothetical protein ACRDVG_03705 [Jatrophihabitantaceae bacterium]
MSDEPARSPHEAGSRPPVARRPAGLSTTLAAGGWLLAATLSVLAAVSNIYTYTFTGAAVPTKGGYDADGNPLDTYLAGSQGPRYSLAMWILAVLFALLALATVKARAGTRPRYLLPVGLAVVALHIGVLAGLGLYIESQFVTYRSLGAVINDGSNGGVDMGIGGCLWLSLAALLCSVAALALVSTGDRHGLWLQLRGSVRRRGRINRPSGGDWDDDLQARRGMRSGPRRGSEA